MSYSQPSLRKEKKANSYKKPILKHPHLYYPCFIVVLYKTLSLVEQVHAN
jgi:hypothetical protein